MSHKTQDARKFLAIAVRITELYRLVRNYIRDKQVLIPERELIQFEKEIISIVDDFQEELVRMRFPEGKILKFPDDADEEEYAYFPIKFCKFPDCNEPLTRKQAYQGVMYHNRDCSLKARALSAVQREISVNRTR
jgi:hypothetical protein